MPITKVKSQVLDTLSPALGVSSGGTGLSSPGSSGNILISNGTAWTSSPFVIPNESITDVKLSAVSGGSYNIKHFPANQTAGGFGTSATFGIGYRMYRKGSYRITARAVISTTTIGQNVTVYAYKNGVNIATLSSVNNGGVGGTLYGSTGSVDFTAEIGDIIAIYGSRTNSATGSADSINLLTGQVTAGPIATPPTSSISDLT